MNKKDKENVNSNNVNDRGNGKTSKKAKNKIGIWSQIKYRLIGIGLGIVLFIITAIVLELFNRLM